MVMEYLRGKSLAKLVEERGGALSEKEAVGYILKVCEALDVVHKAGYLHRDIKPENIIVCEDGRVVLIDFGAARAYMAGKTGRMTVILTPGYAPLEQYAEQAKRGGIHGHLCFGGDFVLFADGSSSCIGSGQDFEGCSGDKREGEQAGRGGGDEGDGDESRRETAECGRVCEVAERLAGSHHFVGA
jgi:serine/threonine protein kinase